MLDWIKKVEDKSVVEVELDRLDEAEKKPVKRWINIWFDFNGDTWRGHTDFSTRNEAREYSEYVLTTYANHISVGHDGIDPNPNSKRLISQVSHAIQMPVTE